MIHIGIDGGFRGAISVLDDEGKIMHKWVMPIIKGKRTQYDILEITKIFLHLKSNYPHLNMKVILEKSQVTPVAGKMACFGMGYYLGMFQGILSALHIPYQLVRAIDWQKQVLKGTNQTNSKQASILFCQRMFPDEDFRASDRCRNVSDGLTDATCMAYYSILLNNKGDEK